MPFIAINTAVDHCLVSLDDPFASVDCPQCSIRHESHLFCSICLIYQPRFVSQRAWHQYLNQFFVVTREVKDKSLVKL